MRIIAVMILMLSFAVLGAAGPSEDADAAIEDDTTTRLPLRLIRPLAEQGDARRPIQYSGVFYDNGLGVPQDRIQGVHVAQLFSRTMQGRERATEASETSSARLMTPGRLAEAQKLAERVEGANWNGAVSAARASDRRISRRGGENRAQWFARRSMREEFLPQSTSNVFRALL